MAFEILDPLPPFSSLSPGGRIFRVVVAMAGLAALIWACDTASRAPTTISTETTQKIRSH